MKARDYIVKYLSWDIKGPEFCGLVDKIIWESNSKWL